MKIVANRTCLLDALTSASGVIPVKTPMPILQSVKLTADYGRDTTLVATDMEVSIACNVLGVDILEQGSVMLPYSKIGPILQACEGENVEIEVSANGMQIELRSGFSEFALNGEDPNLFPAIADFQPACHHLLSAEDLRQMIRRTSFAADPVSVRYALGGAAVEQFEDKIAFVCTDGKRIARASGLATYHGAAIDDNDINVIPCKVLKLIERNLVSSDTSVMIGFNPTTAVMVRTERCTIFSKLMAGRFPRYQDAYPGGTPQRIELKAGPFLKQVGAAAIFTSEESRGVIFIFDSGKMTVRSQSDKGKSSIKMEIKYDGPRIVMSLLPQDIAECLKTLSPDQDVVLELISHRAAYTIWAGPTYRYTAMPLMMTDLEREGVAA